MYIQERQFFKKIEIFLDILRCECEGEFGVYKMAVGVSLSELLFFQILK